MTPLTLSPAEVKKVFETGEVTLERVIEPQPKNVQMLEGKTLVYFKDPVFGGSVLAPKGSTMMGAMQAGQWISKEFPKNPFGSPGQEFFDHNIQNLILIHKETKVEQRDGVWVWVGEFEVECEK